MTQDNPWLAELAERHPYAYKVMINAQTGKLIKDLQTPASDGAHNTIVSLDGTKAFLAGLGTGFWRSQAELEKREQRFECARYP